MNRKELDEKILIAITTLNEQGERPTAKNIQEITSFRMDQIYKSRHIEKMAVRRTRLRRFLDETYPTYPVEPVATPIVATPVSVSPTKSNAIDINLNYQLGKTIVAIVRNNASTEDVDEVIEDLNFILMKSIQKLEREKARLTK